MNRDPVLMCQSQTTAVQIFLMERKRLIKLLLTTATAVLMGQMSHLEDPA